MTEDKKNDQRECLSYGMVGGSSGSFIGPIHRTAMAMNNQARLVAGSFSQAFERTLETGRELGLDPERTYPDFLTMAEREGSRIDRIDFVVIAVPNHLHFPVAKAFLQQGIDVICEKPLTFSMEEANELVRLTRESHLQFMVAYTYTGYPMVREARSLVTSGALGSIRVVAAEYPQGWLTDPIERNGVGGGANPQAFWRTDPRYSGISGCVGDIGTHVENLVHFITGLEIDKLAARLEIMVPGRLLDDNAYMMLRYKGGASGSYWSSQVAIGEENGLRIRVYGEKGALSWSHENPNILRFQKKGEPVQILTRGSGYLSPEAARFVRVPAGHPEGYFEAFANLFRSFCNVLIARKEGRPSDLLDTFPTVEDGARGVKFITDAVQSSQRDSAWVDGSFPMK
ncbi:MAG: Gfo/Idh/MocA family oxidoreductase [Coprothermobacterota bacterium]|nr:Gfo/Idh/MocA family oxidoreductase [Coprothermobacterota bacterium]